METIKFIKRSFAKKNISSEIAEDFLYTGGKNKFNMKLLKKLLPFLIIKWKKGAAASFLLFLATLASIPQPLITKYLIDDVLLKNDMALLNIVIMFFVGLVLIQSLFTFMRDYLFTRFEQEIVLEIQSQLFQRVLRLPKSFFDNKETGYLMSRLVGDSAMLKMFFSQMTVEVFTSFFKFAGGVIILFFLHVKLALISVIIVPVFFLISTYMSRKTHEISFHMYEKSAQVSKRLQSSISGVSLIKSFSTEDRETKRITSSIEESMNASIEQGVVSSVSQLFVGLIASMAGIIVLWVGAVEVFAQRLSLGGLIAFNSYLVYLYGPARFWATVQIQFQSAFVALERVLALHELVSEDEHDKGKKAVDKLAGKVQFDCVSFSYNNGTHVLNNINFSADPGEMIAIVGPTGAGKSTLVNLMLRLYDPVKGKIYFDGTNSADIKKKSLRERIGIVSQEIFLFNETIFENIRYGNPEASEEKVFEAAKASFADDFINELPEGYNTKVGERGVKLSVGQKQRISIARAILRNPDILIFDEPTSALDALAEKAIKKNVFDNSNGKTVFIIAHRLSTVNNADKIIVLSNGSIIQTGTHNELIKKEGLYKEMWEEQRLG